MYAIQWWVLSLRGLLDTTIGAVFFARPLMSAMAEPGWKDAHKYLNCLYFFLYEYLTLCYTTIHAYCPRQPCQSPTSRQDLRQGSKGAKSGCSQAGQRFFVSKAKFSTPPKPIGNGSQAGFTDEGIFSGRRNDCGGFGKLSGIR